MIDFLSETFHVHVLAGWNAVHFSLRSFLPWVRNAVLNTYWGKETCVCHVSGSNKTKQISFHINQTHIFRKSSSQGLIFGDKWAQASLDLLTVTRRVSSPVAISHSPPSASLCFSLGLPCFPALGRDMRPPATGEAGTQGAMTALQWFHTPPRASRLCAGDEEEEEEHWRLRRQRPTAFPRK